MSDKFDLTAFQEEYHKAFDKIHEEERNLPDNLSKEEIINTRKEIFKKYFNPLYEKYPREYTVHRLNFKLEHWSDHSQFEIGRIRSQRRNNEITEEEERTKIKEIYDKQKKYEESKKYLEMKRKILSTDLGKDVCKTADILRSEFEFDIKNLSDSASQTFNNIKEEINNMTEKNMKEITYLEGNIKYLGNILTKIDDNSSHIKNIDDFKKFNAKKFKCENQE